MEGPVYRLYIAEFEKCDAWMRGGVSHFRKYIQPYDMYVVYRLGRSPNPVAPDGFLNAFREMGEQCIVVDAREMKDRDLYAHMLSQIETYSTRDTYIYFLGCSNEYEAIRGKFSCFKSVTPASSFRTGQIQLPDGVSVEKAADRKPDGEDGKETVEPIEATLIEEVPDGEHAREGQEHSDPEGDGLKKGNPVPFFGIAEGEKAEEKAGPVPGREKTPGGNPGKGKSRGGKPWSGNKKGRRDPEDKSHSDKGKQEEKQEPADGNKPADIKDPSPAPEDKGKKEEATPAEPASSRAGKKKNRKQQKKQEKEERTTTSSFASAFLGGFSGFSIGDQLSPGSSHPVKDREDPASGQEEPDRKEPEGEPGKNPGKEPESPGEEKAAENPSPGDTGGKTEDQPGWAERISHDPDRKDQVNREWADRQALEKAIFGVRYAGEMPERPYSELDDSKAKTVSLIADRLILNIKRMVPSVQKQDFSYDDYMEFIATLVKSDNFRDFMEGWMTVSGGILIDRKEMEEAYPGLRREAQYYARTCDILYGEDGW